MQHRINRIGKTQKLAGLGAVLALSLMFSACDQIQDGLDGQLGETETTTTETEVRSDSSDNNDLVTRETVTDTTAPVDTPTDATAASRTTRTARTVDTDNTDAAEGVTAPGEKDVAVAVDKVTDELNESRAKVDITRLTLMEQELSTFHQLMTLAGLEETLKTGQYTLLAPNNTAFSKVPKAQMDELRQNKEKLRQVLMYHLIKNPISSSDLSRLTQAQTLSAGRKLSIVKDVKSGKALVQQAHLVKPDIWTSNGLVHVIDKLLIPAELQS